MEVKEVWVFVAASGALVHGAIVHSNAKVFFVDVSMFLRSDAETDCRSKWNDRHAANAKKAKVLRSKSYFDAKATENMYL